MKRKKFLIKAAGIIVMLLISSVSVNVWSAGGGLGCGCGLPGCDGSCLDNISYPIQLKCTINSNENANEGKCKEVAGDNPYVSGDICVEGTPLNCDGTVSI
jgi:hypothetical protein